MPGYNFFDFIASNVQFKLRLYNHRTKKISSDCKKESLPQKVIGSVK